MPDSLVRLLPRLWRHVDVSRRKQLLWLLCLMVLAAGGEVISIGAVLPFLGVLTAPERMFGLSAAQPLIDSLGIKHPDDLLLPLTVGFASAALLAGALRLLLAWASTRLSFGTGADLSTGIYRRTLYQPYAVHIARNSSEIISGITAKTNGVTNMIMMTLSLAGSGVTLAAIVAALIWVDPRVALTALAGFGAIYGLAVAVTRGRLRANSERVADESTQVVKALQEGLGGIRDILLDGSQETFCRIYQQADLPSRQAQGSSTFIGASPRYITEALGMILIAVLAYVLARQPEGMVNSIPVLGAMALGAQRLLPVLQQTYAAWSAIQGGQASLADIIDLLDQPLPNHASQAPSGAMTFNREIVLEQVGFRYTSENDWVLRNFDFRIQRGERIGFIGVTGSGKSTLLDIVMALLAPSKGMLKVDGVAVQENNRRAWQFHVAHVPQSIFLADSSIEENIAFGQSRAKIDHDRVRQAARQAQLATTIESWPEGYRTRVGERGVRLSGGQRQRIGISRALYKQADVIIFDEATSALDNETEFAVMEAIENLSTDLTLLIIAHRTSTLRSCSRIVELDGQGGYRIIDPIRPEK